jgi:fermentation-respiration switch protein FrsA (DUF1100 family)
MLGSRIVSSPMRLPLLLGISAIIHWCPALQAAPLYNIFVFHPTKFGFYNTQSIAGIPHEDRYFPTKDGQSLHAWYFKVPGAQKTALISHGNGGNLTFCRGLIKLMIDCHCSVFIYDYRGYGKSEGEPSLSGICEDGLAAYDYLVGTCNVEPRSIVLLGLSLGGGITCHIAANRPCAGIILQSTFLSLDHVAEKRAGFVQHHFPDIAIPPSLNNLSALAGKHPPVLIVHGERDHVVPCAEARLLFAAASEPKGLLLLPNAGHGNLVHRYFNVYASKIADFLSTLPSDS